MDKSNGLARRRRDSRFERHAHRMGQNCEKESLPSEDVYDIEIEGTHNFVGNDIIAHNTAFIVDPAGNVGIGTTSPYAKLSVAGEAVIDNFLRDFIHHRNLHRHLHLRRRHIIHHPSLHYRHFHLLRSEIPTGGLSLGSLSGFLKATAGAVATALVDLTADITGTLGVGNGGRALPLSAKVGSRHPAARTQLLQALLPP